MRNERHKRDGELETGEGRSGDGGTLVMTITNFMNFSRTIKEFL